MTAGGFGGFLASSHSPDIDASTPWVAAGDGDLGLLQTSLAELGLAPSACDANGFTFLHAACGYGRSEVIRWLLGLNAGAAKWGAANAVDVNARDGDGDTALHHCDDAESAKLLIEGGADRTLTNDDGQTALEVVEEELREGPLAGEDDGENEDREKLKELLVYLKGLDGSAGAS